MRKRGLRHITLAMALMVGTTTWNPVPLMAEEQTVVQEMKDCLDTVDVSNDMQSEVDDSLTDDLSLMDEVQLDDEDLLAVDEGDLTDEEIEEQMNIDTDGDGLEDYLEKYFETDLEKADTDGDGISDYIEVMVVKTNPLQADAGKDADRDHLSNLFEIQNGTDPVKSDTDGDGLSDYEEIKIYKTSPILQDTDGDGLLDGEEVELSLSPKKKCTEKGVKDGKELFSQVLEEDNIEDVLLTTDNDALPRLSGDVPGLMERRITIESATVVLQDMDSYVIGFPIEIKSDYEGKVTLNLAFRCPNYTPEQIKNFQIAHFVDGQITYFDTNIYAKRISTTITEGGTYFVVNKEAIPAMSCAVNGYEEDTDYDGIPNYKDPTPNDNSFTGKIYDGDYKSTQEYAIDYRAFFKDPKVFNSQLCKASSVYSTMAYSTTMDEKQSGQKVTLNQLMEYQGLSDVQYVQLEKEYGDDHVSVYFIGHRTVTYNGETKDVVVLAIQGTNGGLKQWASNFDVGTTKDFSKYGDWTDVDNHKGFDMTANRILSKVQSYVATYCSGSNEKVYWVTGHSRGAALANVIGAKMQDTGKKNFTYTFAAPNTTTKSSYVTSRYQSIFNIVNKDDFVPCLPCNVWGFKRYGSTCEVSIASNYEKEWESLTGKWDYNPDTIGMDKTISKLGAIFNQRNDAYEYTCKCHGNGSKNDITIKNRGMSKKSRENAIAKIPSNCTPYCKITRHNGKLCFGWDFESCQSPAYFMQDVAAFMAGEINIWRFVVELDVADHYEAAKTGLITSGIGGLVHPHVTESYYVLAKHAQAQNFK